jgi:fatty acid desaturase
MPKRFSSKWTATWGAKNRRPGLRGEASNSHVLRHTPEITPEHNKEVQPPASRFKRGYRVLRSARHLLVAWRATSLWLSVGAAVADALSILAVIGLHLQLTGWVAAVLYPVALLFIARQLRSLEVLVHEGSHWNFTRHKHLNDRVVNVVAAYPVFQDVEKFRESHLVHHELLGHEHDPCRVRFFDLGWNELDRTSARRYLAAMVRKLWAYSASWWRLIGSNLPVLAAGVLWHLLAFVLPLALLISAGGAGGSGPAELLLRGAWVWLAYVGVAFVLVLPPMRFIAEAAKHDYEKGTTTKTGTFSNIGPLHWMLHPHGDGFHLLHHLDPSIPHHRLKAVHGWLMENDPAYASGRTRHHVLEEPPMVGEAGE